MRRLATVVAVAGTLAAAATACGLKTAPVAPELVVPQPATELHASAAADGVRLVWRRPTRYSGGGRMRDIERFEIERATGDAPAWTSVGTLVMEDAYRLRQPRRIEWTDVTAAPGTRYRYRVLTRTRAGQTSTPSAPAAVRHRVVTPDRDRADGAS
jgi:hypothetical protein